ncbi:MAG: DUF3530 family protein, partial [Gammaproteobacteria bacterium]|nr:DUF3530 family protein [Gammaproteobacteria bacterium]
SAHYLASTPIDPSVKAYAAIGVSGTLFKSQPINYLHSVKKIKLPILDIYGSEDLEGVLASAKQRANTAQKAGNGSYTQVKVANANHFFVGKDDELVSQVARWLKQTVR